MNTIILPNGFIRAALCLVLACSFPIMATAADEVYIVKKHDTLSGIARKYDVSTKDLARRNELSNINLLKTGMRLFIPGDEEPEPFPYKVQKGDSIASIAKRFGAPQAEIVKLNKLTDANRIIIGQMLLIPGSNTPSPFSPTLLAQIDGPKIQRGRWKYIVIHHSAADDNPTIMDRHHRAGRGMENGLAYHFVIGGRGKRMEDGDLFVGHRWTGQIDGGHVRSADLNHESIGICLVGEFHKYKPTEKQMEVLEDLVRHLMKQCNLGVASVKTHTQVNPVPTTCPGKYFPTKSFIAKLKN